MRLSTAILALMAALCPRPSLAQDEGDNDRKLEVYRHIRRCTVKVIARFSPEEGAIGTGVGLRRFDDDVIVVTNEHVIQDDNGATSQELKVKPWLKDREVLLPAHVLASCRIEEKWLDVAFLVVHDPERLITIAEPSPDRGYRVGDPVYACGHPMDEEFFLDDGRITAGAEDDWLIYHDAYINHGNSGGGLFDADGRLRGVNTWLKGGKIGIAQEIHAFLGWWSFHRARVRADADWTDSGLDLRRSQSARILAIGKWESDSTNGAYNGGGIGFGDMTRLDERFPFACLLVRSGEGTFATESVWKTPAGQSQVYGDYRTGEVDRPGRLELRINDSRLDNNAGSLDVYMLILGYPRGFLGAELAGITEDERTKYKLEPGQGARVTSVQKFSPAAEARIREGDIIIRIDGHAVGPDDIPRLMSAFWPTSQRLLFGLIRDGEVTGTSVSDHSSETDDMTDPEIVMIHAEAQLVMKSWEDALFNFTWVIERSPLNAGAWTGRARAHEALGNIESALADLSRAIEVARDPDVSARAAAELERVKRLDGGKDPRDR